MAFVIEIYGIGDGSKQLKFEAAPRIKEEIILGDDKYVVVSVRHIFQKPKNTGQFQIKVQKSSK